MQKRIEFIDLAKGICIVLVILEHSFGELLEINTNMKIFRMPLYFVLSGLFFKPYGFTIFVKKKINKLLIPFLFSFLLIVLPINILSYHIANGYAEYCFWGEYGRPYFGTIQASWFLFCLFIVNMYFYLIFAVCKHNFTTIMIVASICGVIGYMLNRFNLHLPIWLDTSLTVLPFFIMGYAIKQHSQILVTPFSLKQFTLLLCSLAILIGTVSINNHYSKGIIAFMNNVYDINVIALYIGGFTGTCSVLLIAKYFTHIPVISYLGRYSIIVLLTHQLYIFILRNILYRLNMPQDSLIVNTFIFGFIIIASIPTIMFCKKYLPYFFAQKDLWK